MLCLNNISQPRGMFSIWFISWQFSAYIYLAYILLESHLMSFNGQDNDRTFVTGKGHVIENILLVRVDRSMILLVRMEWYLHGNNITFYMMSHLASPIWSLRSYSRQTMQTAESCNNRIKIIFWHIREEHLNKRKHASDPTFCLKDALCVDISTPTHGRLINARGIHTKVLTGVCVCVENVHLYWSV